VGQATVALPPAVPPVPSDLSPDIKTTVVRLARGINQSLRGQVSACISVTLVPSDTQSTFTDTRLGPYSQVSLMPMTGHAADVLPSIWTAPTKGSCVINHANVTYTDCTYNALIIGS
jgi:hypothetical protein